MENLNEKKRSTRLFDTLKGSMSRVNKDTVANYKAADKVRDAKDQLARAMEKGSLTPHEKRLNRALAELEKEGNKPPFSTSAGDAYGNWSNDTTNRKGIRGRKPKTSKTTERDVNSGRIPVEKLARAAAEQAKDGKEIPLADRVRDIKDDVNIDLDIGSTYLQMISEQEQSNLTEQVIEEMENILQEQFSEEEFNVMYEYVNSLLKEGRRPARVPAPNMARDYKGTKSGEPDKSPLSSEEMAKSGILTGKGAIHNRKDSDDFSKYFERIQREKKKKGNQQ